MTAFTGSSPIRQPAHHPIVLALVAVLVAPAALTATATPSEATLAERTRVVVEYADTTSAQGRAAALAAADVGSLHRHTDPDDVVVDALALSGPARATAVVEVTADQRDDLDDDPRVAAVYDDIPIRADALDGGPGVQVDAARAAARLAAPAPGDVTPHDGSEASTPSGEADAASTVRGDPADASAVVPDDPAWSDQDGVRRIRGNDVWSYTTGGSDVVIGVIDTGIDPDNPDVAGRLTAGYDFVNDDDDATDDNGHGTAAATIAAGAGDDGAGVAGLCWRCRIMPVKVLDDNGDGFLSDAAYGIDWAVEHGADIINVSLGSPDTMPLLDDALAAAQDAGVLVVASAGNAGSTTKQWPAADARAVAVAALDESDRRADYSNHGAWVELSAPGCNPSGWIDDAIVRFCGTSSSAPLVSGAAALLTAARGAEPATAVRDALRDTAVAVADDGMGHGLVDALAALRALPSFDDIAGSVHATNIETLAAAGVTSGCTTTRYCPGAAVTRGQVATLLDRVMDLPDGSASFTDVPAGHTHADGIGAVAAAGITEGCGDGRYCPSEPLTRAQMASLLARALNLPDGPSRFDDVDAGAAHAAAIWAVAAAGLTQGCTPDLYCPTQAVTRGQIASFLVRAFDL